jgi:site-specific recombinase XerD
MDISEEARSFMGERGKDSDLVFSPFHYSDKMNLKLQHWALSAGVNKRITFHSARHTFALLLLEQSTDIYTVSKLLGHRDVRTTQRYAHILDDKKRQAIDRIPSLHDDK